MIPLTRLNGSPIYLNCDLIKYAEASPDTMLTLIHGEKMVVRESCDEVVERITEYRVQLLRSAAENLPHTLDFRNAASASSAQAAVEHLSEERNPTSTPDPAAIHRRRPLEF
jgi:flagellar protein FlbD